MSDYGSQINGESSATDALIVGGGPTGLTAALTLARLYHTATVFDSGSYRNEGSTSLHLMLTWDGGDPVEFRASARKNILDRYDTIKFHDLGVDTIHRRETDGLFQAVDTNGNKHLGRKVILATGARDVYPPINGFVECWGKGVFHCLICSFKATKHLSAGILVHGTDTQAQHLLLLSRMALQYVDRVTIYTNSHPTVHSALSSHPDVLTSTSDPSPIHLDPRPIASLSLTFPSDPTSSTVTLAFSDSSPPAQEGFVAHRTATEPNNALAKSLGCELAASGEPTVGWKARQTSVKGVFAAGDLSVFMKTAPGAQLDGCMAAWGAAMQIEAERLGHGEVEFADR